MNEYHRSNTGNHSLRTAAAPRRLFLLTILIPALILLFGRTGTRVAAQGQAESDAERAYRTSMESADQSIVAEIQAHSELVKNLEYLTTQIGARLTGSPQMQAASDWTLKRFKDYGIDAHLETAQVDHSWTRGVDTAEITSPFQRRIEVRSLGWSKATDGAVSGNVVVLESQSADAIAAVKDKLKGAIVLLGRPATLPPDSEVPDNAYDAVIPPQRGVPAARGGVGAGGRGGRGGPSPFDGTGVAVILRDSGKTDNLFNMGGAGGGYNPSPMPTAFLTHEDYSLIYRLSQTAPVKMKVSLNGKFSDGPANASITVAEIKGSEFPDERVIIGGHLDSWDLGQGALDNGTGAMAVLEAARTLKSLGWKPKRTITFILFTGEEEGGVGVQTFLKNHAAEIPKMDAVLVHDTGTGKVLSIALENYYETAPLMSQVYRPLQEVLDLQPLSTRYFGSSDHVAFQRVGVAAYFCIQSPAHYREVHHSQTDTFDKLIPAEINQGAALLAAWAWNVSELSQPIPHHPAAPVPNAPPGR
jgi:carboxypeptidase Q